MCVRYRGSEGSSPWLSDRKRLDLGLNVLGWGCRLARVMMARRRKGMIVAGPLDNRKTIKYLIKSWLDWEIACTFQLRSFRGFHVWWRRLNLENLLHWRVSEVAEYGRSLHDNMTARSPNKWFESSGTKETERIVRWVTLLPIVPWWGPHRNAT